LLPALPGEAKRRGDGLRHRLRVTDRGQVDERDAVGPVLPAAFHDGLGQPRLADPARAGQHDQAMVLLGQQPHDLAHVTVPAHQRGGRRRCRCRCRQVPVCAKGTGEAFGQQGRQVIKEQFAQLVGVREGLARHVALTPDPVEHAAQARLHVGRRALEVQQPGQPRRVAELVLQTREGHARPDPAVALPVDADEDLRLLEVGPVHRLSRMWTRARLEHDRDEPQLLDGRARRHPLVIQLAHGSTTRTPAAAGPAS
jgi:hypothetical protein